MSDLIQRVSSVISRFIDEEKLFTILDVSEEVKNDGGVFVRHREVREVAKPILDNLCDLFGYVTTLIDVTLSDGTQREANLYHPTNADPNTYVNRNSASTPPQQAPASVVAPTGPVGKTGLPTSRLSRSLRYRSDGSVQIPLAILVESGFTAGTFVDVVNHPNSISIVKGTSRCVTDNFRVSQTALVSSNLNKGVVANSFSDKIVLS